MKSKVSNISHVGKNVYVWIDMHKRTFSLTAICVDAVTKKWSMPADVDRCMNMIAKHFGDGEIHTVYEAGFSGYSLHRRLLAAGIQNIVVCPSSVQKSPNDRVKTDLLDSKKLATQLAKV